jgi:hypothetical protein
VFRLCTTISFEGEEMEITEELTKMFEEVISQLGYMEERVIG